MGSGKTINIYVHRGAGAYICGEETALMNSIEGRRGNPRIKPPFPAVSGVFAQPTTINNVETLAAVPHILNNGADWYKQWMRADNPKSTGTKLYSVCGNIQKPGNYEVPMGFPFKDFLYDLCGGPLPGRKFRAIIPGRHPGTDPDRLGREGPTNDLDGLLPERQEPGLGGRGGRGGGQNLVKVIA